MTQEDHATGGAPGYRGYEYQIRITAWLALELMFPEDGTTQPVPEIEIEPASHEDIEAQLDVPPERADARFSVRGLTVQIKYSSQQWTQAALRDVLYGKRRKPQESGAKRGPRPRMRPFERLVRDPALTYLFVTNTTVDRAFGSFLVQRCRDMPAQPDSAALVKKGTDPDLAARIASRIALLCERSMDLTRHECRALLKERRFVPEQEADGKLTELITQIRERLLDRAPARLSRETVVQLIGGRESGSVVAKYFVPPRNYDQLRGLLKARHGLVLAGEPGIGKTMVAQALADEHRKAPPHQIVHNVNGPGDIKARLDRPGPVVFVIEDPWGQYQKKPLADLWASELPRLLKEATPDRKLIVTTRTASLRATGAEKEYGEYLQRIEAEHYDRSKRAEILQRYLAHATEPQQAFARANLEEIVDKLKVPLSLERFAYRVQEVKDDLRFSWLPTLLRDSEIAALTPLVRKAVLGIEWPAIPAAFVLWALLSNRAPAFTLEDLDRARELLRSAAPVLNINLDRLIRWLLDERWLQDQGTEFRAHPTTVEGLEQALKERPDEAAPVADALFCAMRNAGDVEGAASLAERLPDPIWLSQVSRQWVAERLEDHVLRGDESSFRVALGRIAAWEGTSRNKVFELVKALIAEEPVTGDGWHYYPPGHWKPPSWPDETSRLVKGSDQCRIAAERYIRWVLPHRTEIPIGGRVQWLRGFGWDLKDALLDGVQTAILTETLALPSLAEAAFLSGASFDDLAGSVEEMLDHLRDWYDQQRLEKDSSPPRDWWEEQGDQEYTFDQALEVLVAARRRRDGYNWLKDASPRLLDAWASVLEREIDKDHDVTDLELVAAYDATVVSHPWKALKLAKASARASLAPKVINTLIHSDRADMSDCLHALAASLNVEALAGELAQHIADIPERRRVQIAVAAHRSRANREHPGLRELVPPAMLPEAPQLAGLIAAELASPPPPRESAPDIIAAHANTLRSWVASNQPDELSRGALLALARGGVDVTDLAIEAVRSGDASLRHAAVQVLAAAPTGSARAALRSALPDEHPSCRTDAVLALAPAATHNERLAILELATDRASEVRHAVVKAIRDGRWDEGVPILKKLLSDNGNGSYDASPTDQSVAMAALEAIRGFDDDSAIDDPIWLLDFVAGGARSSPAYEIHDGVLELLTDCAPPDSIAGAIMKALDELSVQRTMGLSLHKVLIEHLERCLIRDPLLDVPGMERLVEFAHSRDGELAGLATLVLGAARERTAVGLLAVHELWRQEKAFLLLAGATRRKAAAPPIEFVDDALLSHGSPMDTALQWISATEPRSEAEWIELLSRNPEGRKWLEGLRGGGGWYSVMWWVIKTALGPSFEAALSTNRKVD